MIEHRFSVSAETYDRHARPQQILIKALLAELPASCPDRILELGGGTGQLTRRLTQRYPETQIDVIDIAPGMVDFGREAFKEAQHIQWVLGDAQTWKAPAPYPLIVSSAALQWANDLEKTFRNIRENLATDGTFGFGIMLNNTFKELHRLRREIAPDKIPAFELPTYRHTLDSVERAGFTIQRSERMEYLFPYADTRTFLKTIHEQGVTGGTPKSGYVPLSRGQMRELIERYSHEHENSGEVYATYETVVIVAS